MIQIYSGEAGFPRNVAVVYLDGSFLSEICNVDSRSHSADGRRRRLDGARSRSRYVMISPAGATGSNE